MNKQRTTRFKLVVCVKNDDYPASLELRKIYCAIADRAAAAHGLLRVIDESGEDYLYPAGYFRPIQLASDVRKALRLSGESALRQAVGRRACNR
jgi:hypothetical protein